MTPLTTPFDSLFSLSRKCSYDFGSESPPLVGDEQYSRDWPSDQRRLHRRLGKKVPVCIVNQSVREKDYAW